MGNPLPPLKVQYTDYAQWQRNWLQGAMLEKQQTYWQQQLSGISPLHCFPLDNPRPEKQRFEGRMHGQRISKGLTQEIRALCTKYEVTLFMFLETAFAVLLGRYSNEKDILVGTPLAGRVHHDIEPLIGFFVNSLVIRTDLSGQPTFSELLKQNSHTILDAYAHQDLPFEMLVEKISPERNLNYNPIFQIIFTLENTQQNTTLEQNYGVEFDERPLLESRFDLEIHVYEEEQGELAVLWTYDTSLFKSITIDRLMANYETLLSGIVDAMNLRIGTEEPSVYDIPLLSVAEQHRLLHEWNGPQDHSQREGCFHELFEEQVARNPEKTALVFGDTTLSYQALNEQANQLTHYLIELGIQPDTLVALCIPRSLRAVVALLAILKAGGAYVPLDSSYPQARLQYMLEHSGAELILTETHLIEKLPISQQTVICLETESIQSHLHSLPSENITERPFPLTENHLAYVIYTSGSTGKPKGVMLEHKGWVNLALSQAALFGVDAHSRGLQFASWSFDAAVLEISMTLAYGATLYLISETQQRTSELLDDVVEKHQITHAVLPPALLPHLGFNKWRSVTTLLLAGEAVTPQIATRWEQGRKLFNVYGPTECTSIVTTGLLTGGRIVIGKPLPNTVARILDADGRLAPIGAVGELYIGGIQLARGYRNAPEMTAKQFIRDPFSTNSSNETENRLYRTGDLVRWTAEGQLEFIGRIDSQVKVRGYRIELGEIEIALAGNDILSNAAVMMHGDSYGNDKEKKLIAYVCPTTDWLGEKALEFNANYPEYEAAVTDAQYRQLMIGSTEHGGVADENGQVINLGTLTDGEFDTVVINAVAQFVPNRQYLEALFDQLIPAIDAGGKILLGDIRNLDLLTAHITAIEQSRLNGQHIDVGTLANRIQRRLQQEQEFLLSPAYFAQLPQRYPAISRVDILVKRGVGDNEILRYRYDVVLHIRGKNTESCGEQPLAWYDFDSLEKLHHQLQYRLQAGADEAFGVSGIPNARVKDNLALAEGLRHWPANQMLPPPEYTGSLSPEATAQIEAFESLLQYAEQCGYQCGVTWSQHQPDLLDVIFSRCELPSVLARTGYSQTHLTNYPHISAIGNELSELLESALKKQLPEYMVPSLYIPLERMPLTLNNKVDKKALPIPNEEDLRRQIYVAPRNSVERKLCQLWQEHLKVKQVGIHDNFFALGGYSLLAVKITASIRHALTDNFSMHQLFTNPTVAQIANVIHDAKQHEISVVEPLQNTPDGKIPISHCQKMFWSLVQEGFLEDSFHVPITLLINGELDRNALEKSLNVILERHESLRFKFYQENEQIFVQPDNDMKINLQIVDLMQRGIETEVEQEQLIFELKTLWEEKLRTPFDIYNGSLIRAFLLPISETNFVLLIDVNHIIFDGWSFGIFINEFKDLYTAYSQGEEPILPPIAMQYSDYTYDLQKRHKTEEYQKQIKFWQQQFADVNMSYDFPIAFSKHLASKGHFNVRCINTPNSLANAVSHYCETNTITPYMLFMSLFHTCLFMHSGISQHITSSPLADRHHIESQQTIGLFLSDLLVKSTISKEMSLNDIINQISQFIYKALENSDIHMSAVIDAVGKKVRDSIFNVLFNYVDAPNDENWSLPNLDVEFINIEPVPFQSLGINLIKTPQNIICELSYNPELYTEDVVDNLVKYYERLLNVIVSGQEKESISQFYD
ncbi:PvdJ [Xenorhabdus hominickii]|uniref:PvdJ n=1 Tax=Xenorhabdus hominickii TaxID=351679 RepID=A0A2G0Q9U9_XENHO|nr:PvdJ [Xenorhabdus hominickii]